MKKVFLACLVMGLFGSAAYAADGATLYKKCIACHGKDASKVPPGGTVASNTLSEEEIVKALKGYQDGSFGGKAKATMKLQTKNLTDEDIAALAKYIKSL